MARAAVLMLTRNIRILIGSAAILACAVIGAVVIACGSTSGGTTSGMGMATVSLSDPATCSASGTGTYSNVYVTVADVQANTSATASSSDSGWVDLTPNHPNMQIDLLGQANNNCLLATLGDAQQLQAGNYQQIRLILAPDSTSVSNNACKSVNSVNCVVLDDTNKDVYPLTLPSELQTGIKIPSGQIAGGGFNIAAGQTRDLNIDFNTCASIVRTGSGKYILKPVLHAGEVSTTNTSINGKVNVSTGTSTAFSGTVLVALEPEGGSTTTPGTNGLITAEPMNQVVSASQTDGSFVFCPIPSGTYDIVVVAMDMSGQIYEPSIITGVTNGETTGTINVYPVSASTTTTFPATSGVPTGAITVNGQVTTEAAPETVYVNAYETVGSTTYTLPIPADAMTSGQTNLTTASSTTSTPACPSGIYCADFSLNLPVAAPSIGAWSSSGTTLTPSTGIAAYTIDGQTDGCSTISDVQEVTPTLTSSSSAIVDLTSTPFKFTGCS